MAEQAPEFSVEFLNLKTAKKDKFLATAATGLQVEKLKNGAHVFTCTAPETGNKCYKFASKAQVEQFLSSKSDE